MDRLQAYAKTMINEIERATQCLTVGQ